MIDKEKFPSFNEWIEQSRGNPIFHGIVLSKPEYFTLIQSFYQKQIAFSPSPSLRRTFEKELASRLRSIR